MPAKICGGPLDGTDYRGEPDPDGCYQVLGCSGDGGTTPHLFALYQWQQGRLVFQHETKTVDQLLNYRGDDDAAEVTPAR